MVREELWREMQRLFSERRWSKSAIARELGLDVKTVRRSLKQPEWQPYRRSLVIRPPPQETSTEVRRGGTLATALSSAILG